MPNIKIPDHWTGDQAFEVTEFLYSLLAAIHDVHGKAMVAAYVRDESIAFEHDDFSEEDIPF